MLLSWSNCRRRSNWPGPRVRAFANRSVPGPVALRRHEQADAESAANTTTERLFLPGALLLVGFLLFVGLPGVQPHSRGLLTRPSASSRPFCEFGTQGGGDLP